jgi:hypothetical protein
MRQREMLWYNFMFDYILNDSDFHIFPPAIYRHCE